MSCSALTSCLTELIQWVRLLSSLLTMHLVLSESSVCDRAIWHVLINFLSELSVDKEFFLRHSHFQDDTDMFFSVSLDKSESFLWFVQFLSMFQTLLSITNFYDQSHLCNASDASQSCSLIFVSKDSDFAIKSDSLLNSSIVYADTMCTEFVLTLHTLTCLLVFVYSMSMFFQVQFRSDLTLFSFDMWMYKRDSNIQTWLRSDLNSVQTFSEITVLSWVDSLFCR